MNVLEPAAALLRALPRAGPSKRLFSSSSSRQSHIGSAPLTIPTNVTLSLPPLSVPLTNSSIASSSRAISITGPLGEHNLSIPSPIVLHPPTSENPQLSLTVQDSTLKAHRSLWGLTRALLANSIIGVSEGYRLPLRLVGVGYRAAVEPIPPVLRNLLAQPRSASQKALKPEEVPEFRLNMKIGYAHPVYVDIPRDLTVTTPQTTRIVVQGTDKQRVGLFAAKIRRWRKPEPYRGKGIFVGDETIKIKDIKKK